MLYRGGEYIVTDIHCQTGFIRLGQRASSLEVVGNVHENIELLKEFYMQFFGGRAGDKYFNNKKNFESYFIFFDGGATLEIMKMPGIFNHSAGLHQQLIGLAHIAFSTGSREQVDSLTEQLRGHGYRVVSEPRITGDGYYESCILDPDGNRVEITE